jgi:hypothetical protein
MRIDLDCKTGDEWPNLSELGDPVTEQDKIPRFADGTPVHPFGKPKHPWRSLGMILLTWTIAFVVVIGAFWLMFALVAEKHAHADEPSVRIFEQPGECTIDVDLRVSGTKRAACVDKLETAARLAKAEQRVNEKRKKK